jgi:uncharacterized repeat protein (TIGR04076 family)
MPKVVIRVISGDCHASRHHVGDEVAFWRTTPDGFCLKAFAALLPTIMELRDAKPAALAGLSAKRVACPDGVVFEIERVEQPE